MNTSGNTIAIAHWLQSHHQACHSLEAVESVLLGMFFSCLNSTSLLVLSIICDHWIRTERQWPDPMGTVPAQRDAGGDSALLAEVEMHIVVRCPALPLTSLPKPERKVDSALCLAQIGQRGTQGHKCEPGDICCLCQEGGQGWPLTQWAVRAAQSCPVLPWEQQWLRGPHVTYMTSKGKR